MRNHTGFQDLPDICSNLFQPHRGQFVRSRLLSQYQLPATLSVRTVVFSSVYVEAVSKLSTDYWQGASYQVDVVMQDLKVSLTVWKCLQFCLYHCFTTTDLETLIYKSNANPKFILSSNSLTSRPANLCAFCVAATNFETQIP